MVHGVVGLISGFDLFNSQYQSRQYLLIVKHLNFFFLIILNDSEIGLR